MAYTTPVRMHRRDDSDEGGRESTAVNLVIGGSLHADEMVKGAILHDNHNNVADDWSRPAL